MTQMILLVGLPIGIERVRGWQERTHVLML